MKDNVSAMLVLCTSATWPIKPTPTVHATISHNYNKHKHMISESIIYICHAIDAIGSIMPSHRQAHSINAHCKWAYDFYSFRRPTCIKKNKVQSCIRLSRVACIRSPLSIISWLTNHWPTGHDFLPPFIMTRFWHLTEQCRTCSIIPTMHNIMQQLVTTATGISGMNIIHLQNCHTGNWPQQISNIQQMSQSSVNHNFFPANNMHIHTSQPLVQ